MKKHCLKFCNSLCIFFLTFALILSPCTALGVSAAGETTAAETTDSNAPPAEPKDYKYSVTITFGYMSFLYDWGIWNSGSFSYVANESSTNPGAGTEQGKPGWYNFDGINNKINISCQHITANTIEFPFEVNFGSIKENGNDSYKDIYMDIYEEAATANAEEWNMCGKSLKKVSGNNIYLTSSNAAPVNKDIYISFSGEPKNADGTPYNSNLMQKIGYLTLTVGKPVIKP